MTDKVHVRGSDVREYGKLAIDAVLGLTSLVETMHHNILRAPGVLGTPTQEPARGITGFVYKAIRGVTRAVGGGIDALLGQVAPLLGTDASSPQREALLAALNGVLGDHLARTGSGLAIPMQVRREGRALPLTRAALHAAVPGATGRIVLLVHGLCMSDLQWRRHGHDHGAALARDTGCTPLYLHYNSGVHISTNGRQCAALLERLLRTWPVPVQELVILGHSMGGLVARSACHYGRRARHGWLQHLRKMIFVGTPHLGAPLERGGHWIDAILDASPYTTAFARLGKVRSAGITDLHHGSVCDEDWRHLDRFAAARRKARAVPLPEAVECHALAASLSPGSGGLSGKLFGDGLVPVDSALGISAHKARDLAIPPRRRWVGHGMHHLDLLDRESVYARILRCL